MSSRAAIKRALERIYPGSRVIYYFCHEAYEVVCNDEQGRKYSLWFHNSTVESFIKRKLSDD
jgi:hypothetical protein